eukprot:CAMPEP_0182458954 /NCGR_PEP_ID=MMETSP1319-20130603/4175_1 /TAXON_ID=172717 /ORGANISM="Bolidomonas pacifica, Strain RCC208" /LENGTH=297 /DNA_ID=CAMNT_0024657745 /DNA_START=254 /DNA_END=1144 /DNA_ORIENTATION=-
MGFTFSPAGSTQGLPTTSSLASSSSFGTSSSQGVPQGVPPNNNNNNNVAVSTNNTNNNNTVGCSPTNPYIVPDIDTLFPSLSKPFKEISLLLQDSHNVSHNVSSNNNVSSNKSQSNTSSSFALRAINAEASRLCDPESAQMKAMFKEVNIIAQARERVKFSPFHVPGHEVKKKDAAGSNNGGSSHHNHNHNHNYNHNHNHNHNHGNTAAAYASYCAYFSQSQIPLPRYVSISSQVVELTPLLCSHLSTFRALTGLDLGPLLSLWVAASRAQEEADPPRLPEDVERRIEESRAPRPQQ